MNILQDKMNESKVMDQNAEIVKPLSNLLNSKFSIEESQLRLNLLKDICTKMDNLINSYNELQNRINNSKKNEVLFNYLDYFIPLLQDISKKIYVEYLRFNNILAEIDNEFIKYRKKINDEIISLLYKQANRDGQNVLGVFNHPEEIDHDEIIDKVKKCMNN